MGLFGKLFGGGPSLDRLRRAVQQKRYADARILAEELLSQDLDEREKQDILPLAAEAGDQLARMNFEEGLGFQRNGQFEQAMEYLQLASELVHSDSLRDEISAAMGPQPDPTDAFPRENAATADRTDGPGPAFGEDDLQLDLILTSYPEELRQRYEVKSPLFKKAFLQTHSGDDRAALDSWLKVPDQERDELYFFELGSLYGRSGALTDARTCLEEAVKKNPQMALAIEALVTILLGLKEFEAAEKILRSLLEEGMNPRFCHAQLTYLYASQGEFEKAAREARLGLTVQNGDPAFLQLAAQVFEQLSAFDEAETALKRIPAGGCCGGISLPLAEFWLRRNKELGRILDVFNAACREDPENPRWQLRAAQTYLARNWRKDALKLFRKVVGDPRLDPDLAEEAARQLALLQE